MHTSSALYSDLKVIPCCQQNVVKKADSWLGREVYAATNFTRIRWQGIAAAIISTLGFLLMPFVSPLASAAVVGLGVILGIKTIYDLSKENPLESALIEVIGNKQKFDQLPEFCLTPQNRNEMRNHPKRFVLNGVAEQVMRVTRDKQTHGVLFKYQVENAKSVERCVRIFLFREPFDTLSSSFKIEDNGTLCRYSVDIRKSMKGREARAFVEMIHRGNFNLRESIDQ